jgi:alanine racemase
MVFISDTRAEINLKAIAHNTGELRRVTAAAARLMAVVKADAYGHGLEKVARTAIANGADALAVARPDEAISLRGKGISSPVLVLGYTAPDLVDKMIALDLTQTVFSKEVAQAYSIAAERTGKKLNIHIKVDTGMGRLGFLPGYLSEVESVARLRHLNLEGIFTHFAKADYAEKNNAKKQLEIFLDLIKDLGSKGIEIPIKHAANSAALIDMPESHLDMVRPGISIYGLYPSKEVNKNHVSLQPAMALKSKIVQIKKVPAGFRVSYGGTYTTEKPTVIATVPAGYADGYNRLLSSCGTMLVCGQRAPVVGRVCMDLTMLDVGHIDDACQGSEVVLLGKQGSNEITADEIAETTETINYEVVSTITGRVSRIYL